MKGHVILFCPALIAGGLERVISILCVPFADHYDKVEIVTWHNRPVFYSIDRRVSIICAEQEVGSKSIIKRGVWLRRYVKNNRPDVFISFSSPFNMISLISLFGLKTKVLVSERNDPAYFRWGRPLEMLKNLLYKNADGIMVQTETCKANLGKGLSEKAVVIPNPILMDESLVGSALRTKKEKKIVTACRLVPQKRLDVLIRAFSFFVKGYPDYKLIIFGEGVERDHIQELIKEADLIVKIKLPGVVENLWEEMVSAEMFVMTSEYEGMSNSLLEAMCLGLPCISTKVSGAVDLIRHGENGLLVESSNADAIINAMRFIAENKELQNKLGKNACHLIDILKASAVANQWIKCIDSHL